MKIINLNLILFNIGLFFQFIAFADKELDSYSFQRVLMAKQTVEKKSTENKSNNNSTKTKKLAEAPNQATVENKASKNSDSKENKASKNSDSKENKTSKNSDSKENKTSKNSDSKENKKTDDKKKPKETEKRKVAGEEPAYKCSEFWTDEFSYGYVQLGVKCSTKSSFCISFLHIERNYCEGDDLIRYYCDPNQPALFSTEIIKCKKSCEFSGLSGTCVK